MSDLWTEASIDHEADAHLARLTAARIRFEHWPFLAGAESRLDYENRKALVGGQAFITAAGGDLVLAQDLESSFNDDFDTLHGAKLEAEARARITAEAERRRQVNAAFETVAEGGRVCEVCSDPITRDPKGEDPRTWHHTNGEKHDHEAKPASGGYEDEGTNSHVGSKRALLIGEMEGRAYEATCPNTECEWHGAAFVHDDLSSSNENDDVAKCPECETPLVWSNRTGSKQAAKIEAKCDECGKSLGYQETQDEADAAVRTHKANQHYKQAAGLDNLGDNKAAPFGSKDDDEDDEKKEAIVRRERLATLLQEHYPSLSRVEALQQAQHAMNIHALEKAANYYCPTHKVYVGDGNRDTHAGCKLEQRKSTDAKTADQQSITDGEVHPTSYSDGSHAASTPEGGTHRGPKDQCPLCTGGDDSTYPLNTASRTAERGTPTCPNCGSAAVTYSKAKLYDGKTSKCSSCGHTFDQGHAYDTSTNKTAIAVGETCPHCEKGKLKSEGGGDVYGTPIPKYLMCDYCWATYDTQGNKTGSFKLAAPDVPSLTEQIPEQVNKITDFLFGKEPIKEESLPVSATIHQAANTPWGASDQSEQIAPGIVWYSTPGHGGCHVSDGLMAQMHPALAEADKFAPRGWFEEDVAYQLVAYSFPDKFAGKQGFGATAEQVKSQAREALERYYPEALAAAEGTTGSRRPFVADRVWEEVSKTAADREMQNVMGWTEKQLQKAKDEGLKGNDQSKEATCPKCGGTGKYRGMSTSMFGTAALYDCADCHKEFGLKPTKSGAAERHSETCPRCGEHMDDVTVQGTTLVARCDECGWSGEKRRGASLHTAGENPFAKKPKGDSGPPKGESKPPAAKGDKAPSGDVDPTTLHPGSQINMHYVTPDGQEGDMVVTFQSGDGNTFMFTGDTGEFGVMQQGGKWTDTAGGEFTFSAVDQAAAQQQPPPAHQQAPAKQAPDGNPFAKHQSKTAIPSRDYAKCKHCGTLIRQHTFLGETDWIDSNLNFPGQAPSRASTSCPARSGETYGRHEPEGMREVKPGIWVPASKLAEWDSREELPSPEMLRSVLPGDICRDCFGAGSVPQSGGEDEEDVDNGYVRCPTCGGTGKTASRKQADLTHNPETEGMSSEDLEGGDDEYNQGWADGQADARNGLPRGHTWGMYGSGYDDGYASVATHNARKTANPYAPAGNPYVPDQTMAPGIPEDMTDGPPQNRNVPPPQTTTPPTTTKPRQKPAGQPAEMGGAGGMPMETDQTTPTQPKAASVDIVCMGCGNTGEIEIDKLAVLGPGIDLSCRHCGSTDLDVADNGEPMSTEAERDPATQRAQDNAIDRTRRLHNKDVEKDEERARDGLDDWFDKHVIIQHVTVPPPKKKQGVSDAECSATDEHGGRCVYRAGHSADMPHRYEGGNEGARGDEARERYFHERKHAGQFEPDMRELHDPQSTTQQVRCSSCFNVFNTQTSGVSAPLPPCPNCGSMATSVAGATNTHIVGSMADAQAIAMRLGHKLAEIVDGVGATNPGMDVVARRQLALETLARFPKMASGMDEGGGFIATIMALLGSMRNGNRAIPGWFPKSLLTPDEQRTGQWISRGGEGGAYAFGSRTAAEYPLECYSCGKKGTNDDFGLGNNRKCPQCGSYEVHSPDAGKKSSRETGFNDPFDRTDDDLPVGDHNHAMSEMLKRMSPDLVLLDVNTPEQRKALLG